MPQNYTKAMKKQVKIYDKTFELSIPEAEILQKVQAVADKLSNDYAGKNPIMLGVLNGSFIFCADLVRAMTTPCEISFVKLSSYAGTSSTGVVKEMIGLNDSVEGRHVIIVEDIVESGRTLKKMKEILDVYSPASVAICSLFFKPSKLQVDLKVDYPAMVIPDDFIVGYGLDYNEGGRELRDVYTLK